MSPTLPQIAVQDLRGFVAAFVAAHPDGQVQLLDVREGWELDSARLQLPGTRLKHIAMGELPARLAELDAAQPILALCHHGMRSLQCVAFLQRQGFADVYNVQGGIDAWSREVDPSVPRY